MNPRPLPCFEASAPANSRVHWQVGCADYNRLGIARGDAFPVAIRFLPLTRDERLIIWQCYNNSGTCLAESLQPLSAADWTSEFRRG